MNNTNRLKELRSQTDILAKTIAHELDIAPRTYQRYENGEIDIPISKITFLADYFGVSIDYLVCRNDDINTPTESVFTDTTIDKLASEYKLDDLSKKLIKEFVTLDKKNRAIILDFGKRVFESSENIATEQTKATKESMDKLVENVSNMSLSKDSKSYSK